MAIARADAIGYLERLGFGVEDAAANGLDVTPPSWRPDVVRPEDLVEELGRVHGYETIPEKLPEGTTIRGGSSGFELWCDRVREVCLRAGFAQTISYSLRDAGPLDEPCAEAIVLRNPISPEAATLRSSLLPCLAENARRNGGRDVHLFEQGRVFIAPSQEEVRLGLISHGLLKPADWQDKEPQSAGFFTLKGVIEEIMDVAGVEAGFLPGSDPRLHPTKQAELPGFGILGQIHPDAAEAAGIPADTVVAELALRPMYGARRESLRLKPISRNPAVRRDIALLIDKSVPFRRIEQALEGSIGEVLEDRWLFDVYEGKGIPEGKHSLAIALQLRKQGSNFTDEEANQVRERAVAALAALGGTTR